MIHSPSRLMTHIGVNVGHLVDFAAEATALYRLVIHNRSRYRGLHNELSNSRTRALASGFDIGSADCAGHSHLTRVSSTPSLRWRLVQSSPSDNVSSNVSVSETSGASAIGTEGLRTKCLGRLLVPPHDSTQTRNALFSLQHPRAVMMMLIDLLPAASAHSIGGYDT